MKAEVRWVGDRTFEGGTASGHKVVLGTAHGEGAKPGPSAMELVLIGAGGCSAWDVVNILEKSRVAIDGCSVELEADRAGEEPKVFTRIHMHFVVSGRDVDPRRVERAIALSVEKYCSAIAMLQKTATVTHDYELVVAPAPAGGA
jgi:putative redox protein